MWWGKDGKATIPAYKRFLDEVRDLVAPSIWEWDDVGHTDEAKKEVIALFPGGLVFETPKPSRLIARILQLTTKPELPQVVLDFFAGSGTTAYSTITQNREDGGQRKFVIVEVGEYFDTLVAPRLQKVMYAPDWRTGQPIEEPNFGHITDENTLPDWVLRSPRLVKILRLESYEDSLDALELPQEREERLRGQLSLFGAGSLVKYLLEVDGRVGLNTRALETPFSYALDLHRGEGQAAQVLPVDLVETFNLLIGCHVQRQYGLQDGDRAYVVVEALEEGRPVVVVWRDVAGLDPARERAFLTDHFAARGRPLTEFSRVYTNADNALPNGRSLDAEFKRRMLEPVVRGLL